MQRQQFVINSTQVRNFYERYKYMDDTEIQDSLALVTQLGFMPIRLYHAGSIDWLVETDKGNTLFVRDQLIMQGVQQLNGSLDKKIATLSPYTHAGNLMARLMLGDSYAPQDLDYVFKVDEPRANEEWREMLWQFDRVMMAKESNVVLFDLLNTNTVGTYVELVNAMLLGKAGFFMTTMDDDVVRDPFIEYALKNYSLGHTEAEEQVDFSSLAGTVPDCYLETLTKMGEHQVIGTLLQGGNPDIPRFKADQLLKAITPAPDTLSKYVTKEDRQTKVRIFDDTSDGPKAVPWAIAYLHLSHILGEEVIAQVPNWKLGETYLLGHIHEGTKIPRVDLSYITRS